MLMGQRAREKEDKIALNLKPTKPLIGMGQCCSCVVSNYQGSKLKDVR
jgi:hypothetical protein